MASAKKEFPQKLKKVLAKITKFSFQKERRSVALDLPLGHDCNTVAENVGLLHEVGGQQDGPGQVRGIMKLYLQEIHGYC